MERPETFLDNLWNFFPLLQLSTSAYLYRNYSDCSGLCNFKERYKKSKLNKVLKFPCLTEPNSHKIKLIS